MSRFESFTVEELNTIMAGLIELEMAGAWTEDMVNLMNEIVVERNKRGL